MTQHRVLFLITLAAVCVVGVVVLVFAYQKLSRDGGVPAPAPVLETVVEDAGEGLLPPLLFVSGVIQEVSGESLVLVPIGGGSDSVAPASGWWTVIITGSTTVVRTAVVEQEGFEKKMEVFRSEMDEYTRAVQEFYTENGEDAKLPANLMPPVPPTKSYEKVVASVDVLEEGQTVGVLSKADIRTKEEFIAGSIEILFAPPASVSEEALPPVLNSSSAGSEEEFE